MIPTFAGFVDFVRNQAGMSAAVLPDDSQYLQWAYAVAIETVNLTLQQAAPVIYALAVYNLGASNLLNFAQDVAGQNFFQQQRKTFNLNGPLLGPLTSTSDEGTSVSVATPGFVDDLSLNELLLLKEPFGRRYLQLAQKAGSVWGLA